MSNPMTTRGPFDDDGMTVKWMLQSGRVIDHVGPRSVIQDGVQLSTHEPVTDMDLHEAGDLYAALEAHMENVAEAAPITPEERDRLLRKGRQDRILKGNLEAVRDEFARPLNARGARRGEVDGYPEWTGPAGKQLYDAGMNKEDVQAALDEFRARRGGRP